MNGLGGMLTISSQVKRFSDSAVLVGVASLGFAFLSLLVVNSTLNQLSSIDPYVYAAYVNDYSDTFHRFGPTYYSTRVSYIFIEHLFTSIFGTDIGYHFLRLTALASATAAVLAIARRYYGWGIAIAAAAWLCFSPWLLRSLLSTHYDGFATVYFILGLAFLLAPKQRSITTYTTAGAFFALSVNCNLVILAVGAALFPAWVILEWPGGLQHQVKAAIGICFGFVGTELLLGYALHFTFPEQSAFAEAVALRVALGLLGGGLANWFVPLETTLRAGQFAILIPTTLFLATALLPLGKSATASNNESDRSSFKLATAVYIGMMIVVALLQHYVFKSGWVHLFYYNVYFVPACALGIMVVAGEVERQFGSIIGKLVLLGTAVALASFWFAGLDFCNLQLTGSLTWWLFVILVTVVSATAARWVPVATIVVFGGVIAMTFSLYGSSGREYCFRIRSSVESELEWDIYKGAIFLQRYIEASIPAERSLGVWANQGPGQQGLLELQSMYLWDYSRVVPGVADYLGMPLVDDRVLAGISRRSALVLLGLDTNEIDFGLAALGKASIEFQEIGRNRYQGKRWGYVVALVSINKPLEKLGDLLFKLPLSTFQASNGGVAVIDPNGVKLITAPQRGYYSLEGTLQSGALDGPAVVRIQLSTEAGRLGINIVAAQDRTVVLARTVVEPRTEMQTVDLPLLDLGAAGSLNFINDNPQGGSSRATIHSVQVFRRP